MRTFVTISVEAGVKDDLAQLVRNGIEQERRRPKFGNGAVNSAVRIAKLTRVLNAIEEARAA